MQADPPARPALKDVTMIRAVFRALFGLKGVLALSGLAITGAAFGYAYSRGRGPSRPAPEVPRVAVRRMEIYPSLVAGGQVESTKKTLIECELENLSYSNEGRSLSASGS